MAGKGDEGSDRAEVGMPAAPAVSTDVRHTVVALFDDTIDAEQALTSLRKVNQTADRVSLVVRDREGGDGEMTDRAGAVARAMVANALEHVGVWLQGLASLIVPERGTFLVAGPIGAALAGISAGDDHARPGDDPSLAPAGDQEPGGLLRTMADFGFNADEGTYLEHRLVAGAALVAVTTSDDSSFKTLRRLFADHAAVYIGMARTDAAFLREAEGLLASPPEISSGGDVVVTDAVAPIRRLSQAGALPEAAALRHRAVVDVAGEPLGEVDDVLVEVVDPDGPDGPAPERHTIRYLVVGHGGVLNLGRRRVAVPVTVADLGAEPIRLTIAKAAFQRAPGYDDDAPFSRREEQAICAHFACDPYWSRP